MVRTRHGAGYTLVEIVIYAAILAVISALVVTSILRIGGAFAKAKALRELNVAANVAMERTLREIRLAYFASNILFPYQLLLNTYADPQSQTLTSAIIFKPLGVSSEELMILKPSSGSQVSLLPDDVKLNNGASTLKFTVDIKADPTKPACNNFTVENCTPQGVRVEMELATTVGREKVTAKYYGFAVMRGSYPQD